MDLEKEISIMKLYDAAGKKMQAGWGYEKEYYKARVYRDEEKQIGYHIEADLSTKISGLTVGPLKWDELNTDHLMVIQNYDHSSALVNHLKNEIVKAKDQEYWLKPEFTKDLVEVEVNLDPTDSTQYTVYVKMIGGLEGEFPNVEKSVYEDNPEKFVNGIIKDMVETENKAIIKQQASMSENEKRDFLVEQALEEVERNRVTKEFESKTPQEKFLSIEKNNHEEYLEHSSDPHVRSLRFDKSGEYVIKEDYYLDDQDPELEHTIHKFDAESLKIGPVLHTGYRTSNEKSLETFVEVYASKQKTVNNHTLSKEEKTQNAREVVEKVAGPKSISKESTKMNNFNFKSIAKKFRNNEHVSDADRKRFFAIAMKLKKKQLSQKTEERHYKRHSAQTR